MKYCLLGRKKKGEGGERKAREEKKEKTKQCKIELN